MVTPVKWSFSKKKLSDSEYQLIFKASIENTWHLYSQNTPPPPDGPLPTVFTFEKNPGYELVGKTTEPNTKPHYDPVFEQNIKYFDKEAIFTQKVRVLTNKPVTVKGMLEYQACDDSKCMSGDDEYSFTLEGNPQAGAVAVQSTVPVDTAAALTPDSAANTKSDTASDAATKVNVEETTDYAKINSSLWALFFFSFLAGLAAILTPCVFPMIPMTVSYFMKINIRQRQKSKPLYSAFPLS
jgi:thiol:disulfide interchange protein DsbD